MLRLRFLDLLVSKWLEPALRNLTLPLAVILNRFAAALFVFFFGILANPSDRMFRPRLLHPARAAT